MLRVLRGLVRVMFVLVVLGAVGIGAVAAITLMHFGRDLPDTQQLANYIPATGSKVYAGDGSFIAEFEAEHRTPVPIAKVPKLVIQAFLAAEDRDFYNHNGVNPAAIFRAAMADILRVGRGQRPMGASTITQQVVRHFLLTNEVSISRKIKEALLAYRIEHTLSKDRILEIYLNEIYLGAGAYGVTAAAETYFQKPLDQLTLAETALLAALPKAPNNYNPLRHQRAARTRRDYVIAGMADLGWISQAAAKTATAEPVNVHVRPEVETGANGYFPEEVRRELIGRFGEKVLLEGGLSVHTSYVPQYQQMAETAFRNGLVEYDRRHGWRGPIAHYNTAAEAQTALLTMADPVGMASWQLAAVTAIDGGGATVALRAGGSGRVPLEELRWARHTIADQRLGAAVRQVRDVLNIGDIVLVEPVSLPAPPAVAKGKSPAAPASPSYGLRQIPDVSGGTVVMDPKTGRVFAMVGGWSFQQSQFNRVTQAKRQPGSSFKPFVYVTALQHGFTPSTSVEDTPIEISQGPGQAAWSPVNYEGNYIGTTTLEDALVHSRNLATVHVAQQIGLQSVAQTVQDFDIMDRMPLYYSMALGAGETTLLRLTTAYSMLDNDGHWLLPSLIDLVQDRNGKILYQKGVNGCAACFVAAGPRDTNDASTLYKPSGAPDPSSIYVPGASYAEGPQIYKPTKRDPLVTPDADAQIISMMQGVVQRGTGIEVAKVGKPIAGKTGTTSDWFDGWFVGFSPDLAAGVFVGFDDPRTLGDGETGGHVAAPVFRDFMTAALKDKPAKPFTPPPGASVAIANASPNGDGYTDPSKPGGPKSKNPDLANLNDPNLTQPEDADIGNSTRTGSKRQQQDAAVTQDPGTPFNTENPAPWPDYNQRQADYPPPVYNGSSRVPGYAMSRTPGYPPPQMPGYPAQPYGAPSAPGYYGQPQAGWGYPPPQMPAYAAPRGQSYGAPPSAPTYYAPPPGVAPWAPRPSPGTGGLY